LLDRCKGAIVTGDGGGDIFKGGSPPEGPQEVDASAWLKKTSKLEDDSLFEDVFPLERCAQVISLLSLS
jgi:hypothetical protein